MLEEKMNQENNTLKEKALNYHNQPLPGKFATKISKPLKTREDFGLSYTPGVAQPCLAIHENIMKAYEFTSKGNIVAVITNGTAVLGLGDIGALAGKPVMEGKAILFKYLAGIDAVDIEIEEKDEQKLTEYIRAISPTFGGINLEDVSAPSCFAIDKALHTSLGIPFFHDDQSGTAVVVAAAIQNALFLNKKEIGKVKFVVSGAGAAALACIDLLIKVGADIKNFHVFDSKGLLHNGKELDGHKKQYAQEKDSTIRQSLENADIFIGLSRGNLLTGEDIKNMAKDPIILAMANPTPEIMPDIVKAARPDAIVGTGRSDFPNQVNNVLCFPFLFRGALDVMAKSITLNMQLACCNAILECAKNSPKFGPGNIMPDIFEPTLLYLASKMVALAAIKDGVAQKALPENYYDLLDIRVYGQKLNKNAKIPNPGNTQANDLINILKTHGITAKSEKTLYILSKEEILKRIQKQNPCTIIFEHMNIGHKTNDIIQTNDIINTIEITDSPFLGIITESEILFNLENRIWYSHILCEVKHEEKSARL